MIRSGDFYKYCNDAIATSGQVDRVFDTIDSFSNESSGIVVNAGGKEYKGKYLFNSTLNGINLKDGRYISLLQHFRGWLIETNENVFNPDVATLMDFRIPQTHGTAFFYTLPLSGSRALVEYTLFTKEILADDEYRRSLEDYIATRISPVYKVTEEENGVIPMTNYPFKASEGNVINIGTAGGQTKSSTGYTFQFIQKGTARIVSALATKGELNTNDFSSSGRFARYDSILLRVLDSNPSLGADLFTDIFRKGSPHTILRFLDNESSFGEELAIMGRMPKLTFLKAAINEFFQLSLFFLAIAIHAIL
jgi:lycopene beta-cyclase